MGRGPTKADLQKRVEQLVSQLADAVAATRNAKGEAGRHKMDSERHERNWRQAEERLKAGKAAISQELKVRHKVGVEPETEWFRGENVCMEDETNEVRFLRYLFDVINNDVPF